MVTEVIMKRELFGEQISQKSKSEFFSATDLSRAGNYFRSSEKLSVFNLAQFLESKSTKEFIKEIEEKLNVEAISKSRGRNSHTWVHPLLFVDIALAISPKLKVEVYEWMFDHLIKNRNDSGDSYKEMSASLYARSTNKRDFAKFISDVANYIKKSIGVDEWNEATQAQLELRNKTHVIIKAFCSVLTDPRQAVRLGVKEALDNLT